jgi:hypothetical protein
MYEKTYELAGGLSPEGRVRFSVSEIQSVGPYYGDIRVTLRNGRTYVISGRHQELLRVL